MRVEGGKSPIGRNRAVAVGRCPSNSRFPWAWPHNANWRAAKKMTALRQNCILPNPELTDTISTTPERFGSNLLRSSHKQRNGYGCHYCAATDRSQCNKPLSCHKWLNFPAKLAERGSVL
jgi:hypothetical protein